MLGEYIKFCLLNEMQSINNTPQIFNFGFCELFPPLLRYPLEKSNTLLFNIGISIHAKIADYIMAPLPNDNS